MNSSYDAVSPGIILANPIRFFSFIDDVVYNDLKCLSISLNYMYLTFG